jgi:hypothetical protein
MILSGRAPRERKLAISSGGAGLEPHVRAELLTVLAKDEDEMIAQRAQGALLSVPPDIFLSALRQQDMARPLYEYAADNLATHAGVADAMANNPKCPHDLVARLAGHLSPMTVQGLVEDLERLTAAPELVEALASSSSLTVDQKKILDELQAETDAKAIETAVAEAEPDVQKRMTLIQKLAGMRVIERVQLAIKGNREDRMALIRDANKMVQRAVLQSPRITDQEIEGFAAMAGLTDEILRLIAANRNFIKNYVVVKNLTNNPKTPIDVSLHQLPRLTPQDLKSLCTNKNVPEVLRMTAMKLQRTRKELKKPGS